MKRISVCFIVLSLSLAQSVVAKASPTITFNPVQDPILSQEDVESAQVVTKEGHALLELKLKEPGATRLKAFSQRNVGKKLAVFVDHQFMAAPVIRVPITGDRLQVDFTDDAQARELARAIHAPEVK